MTPAEYADEAELQRVLEEHPELLRDEDEPPLYCLGSGVRIEGAGIADMLLVDGDGQLSIAEVKLARNAQSHREVLAQAMDYTSALARYAPDQLNDQLGGALAKRLQSLAGEGPDSRDKYSQLWQSCASSMRAGAVRLVVAMDKPQESLARMVDFANQRQQGMRLIIVRKYTSGDRTILVPELAVHGSSVGSPQTNLARSARSAPPAAFADALNAYKKQMPADASLGEGGPTWRIIEFAGVPDGAHYELQWYRRRVLPSIHIEEAGAAFLADVLRPMEGQLREKFPGSVVKWDPSWYGYGRLMVQPPDGATPEAIAQIMVELPRQTLDSIVAAVARRKKRKN